MAAWKITHDHTEPEYSPHSSVGVEGPAGSAVDWSARGVKGNAFAFRMYDDDGELYYEGLSTAPDEFAPLDDYGAPNAGCTEIRYREHGRWGKWVTL